MVSFLVEYLAEKKKKIKLFENKVQKIVCSDYFSLISGRNAVILPVLGRKKSSLERAM